MQTLPSHLLLFLAAVIKPQVYYSPDSLQLASESGQEVGNLREERPCRVSASLPPPCSLPAPCSVPRASFSSPTAGTQGDIQVSGHDPLQSLMADEEGACRSFEVQSAWQYLAQVGRETPLRSSLVRQIEPCPEAQKLFPLVLPFHLLISSPL